MQSIRRFFRSARKTTQCDDIEETLYAWHDVDWEEVKYRKESVSVVAERFRRFIALRLAIEYGVLSSLSQEDCPTFADEALSSQIARDWHSLIHDSDMPWEKRSELERRVKVHIHRPARSRGIPLEFAQYCLLEYTSRIVLFSKECIPELSKFSDEERVRFWQKLVFHRSVLFPVVTKNGTFMKALRDANAQRYDSLTGTVGRASEFVTSEPRVWGWVDTLNEDVSHHISTRPRGTWRLLASHITYYGRVFGNGRTKYKIKPKQTPSYWAYALENPPETSGAEECDSLSRKGMDDTASEDPKWDELQTELAKGFKTLLEEGNVSRTRSSRCAEDSTITTDRIVDDAEPPPYTPGSSGRYQESVQMEKGAEALESTVAGL